MTGKQALLRTALAVCVPVAGFAIGRSLAPRPAADLPPAAVAGPTARRADDLSSRLCEIAGGNLTAARARIAVLKDTPGASQEELVKLLTAIARKDGASFDVILSTFPDTERADLVKRCLNALAIEPAAFVRLIAESRSFSELALKPPHERTDSAIRKEPGVFLDLLEQGRFPWSPETLESVAGAFSANSADTLRLLALCNSGQVKISSDETLSRLLLTLDDGSFEKLRSNPSDSRLAALVKQESKARALFANFDPTGKSWEGIGAERLISGMEGLISSSGVPKVQWNSIPEDIRDVLPAKMLEAAVHTQGDPGARVLLDSIKDSGLPEEERNRLLADSASALFSQQGNIRLAIDFAKSISNDSDGHNAGEDLLINWMAFDPASAQAYTDKIDPSTYRDRILARVREITP